MDKIKREDYRRANLREEKREGLGFKLISTLLAMYVITGILLFVLAFLLYRFQLEEQFVQFGILAVYMVTGFVGGSLMEIRTRRSCGFCGLLLGSLYFLVLFIGSYLLNHGMPEEEMRFVAVWILCGCAGMLGGMIRWR